MGAVPLAGGSQGPDQHPAPLLSQQETEAQEAVRFPQFTQYSQGRAQTTDKSTVAFTSLNSRPRNLVSRKQKDCWWQSEGLGQVWRLSAPQPKLLESGSSASLPAVGGAEAAQPSESPRVITGGLCTRPTLPAAMEHWPGHSRPHPACLCLDKPGRKAAAWHFLAACSYSIRPFLCKGQL